MKEVVEGMTKWKAIHELKEVMLLKCPYYTKPPIDSIQFLSRV